MNLISKLKDKNNRGYEILGFIVLIILIGTGVEYYKQCNIQEFRDKTTGKIIDFEFINMKRYYIRYEYNAKGIDYTGRTGVSFFKCDDGQEGCVGETFTIYYSSENPSYSKIDLGKYEKYKTKVEFFD